MLHSDPSPELVCLIDHIVTTTRMTNTATTLLDITLNQARHKWPFDAMLKGRKAHIANGIMFHGARVKRPLSRAAPTRRHISLCGQIHFGLVNETMGMDRT